MGQCQVEGCSLPVSKPDHDLCLDHWRGARKGLVKRCSSCNRWYDHSGDTCSACAGNGSAPDEAPAGFLSSTKIGKHFGLSNIKINLILAELGWIEKYVKGWVPTDRGNAIGANVKEMRNGTPFVVWPAAILNNAALLESIGEQSGTVKPRREKDEPDDFRKKFRAEYCTTDGHCVRSRAEVLIDNWLYMQGIIHAYERRLPIEEDCYCDFYLPGGKGVYIEYWGREKDAKYRERKAVKQAIYAKHGLRLIELGDAELERLDDVLPRMLLRFGIGAV